MAKRTHTNEVKVVFTDEFSKGFDSFIKKVESGNLISKKLIRELDNSGRALTNFGMAGVRIIGGALKESITTAARYETAFARVARIADTTIKPIETIKDEMREISETYGQDIEAVGNTFYNIISARGGTAEATAEAKKYAEIASQMAFAGDADIDTAVRGLALVMASYGDLGYTIERVGDILAQTQVSGYTTINELSQTLGTVVPMARAVNLPFEDLAASLATLTSNGLDTSMAVVTMKNALTTILNPSAQARKNMEALGIAYGSDALESGFGAYLDNLKKQVGVTKDAQEELEMLMIDDNVSDEDLTSFLRSKKIDVDTLLTLFKNIRGATAMISLTGSLNKYNQYRESMEEETSGGRLKKQADIMMSTTDAQVRMMQQDINAIKEMFGVKLLPQVQRYLEKFKKVAEWFSNLDDSKVQTIVDFATKGLVFFGITTVIGKILSAIATLLKVINILVKPIGLIMGLIAKIAVHLKAVATAGSLISAVNAMMGSSMFSTTPPLLEGAAEAASAAGGAAEAVSTAVGPVVESGLSVANSAGTGMATFGTFTETIIRPLGEAAPMLEGAAPLTGSATPLIESATALPSTTVSGTGLATAETFTSTHTIPLTGGLTWGTVLQSLGRGIFSWAVTKGIEKGTDYIIENDLYKHIVNPNEYIPEAEKEKGVQVKRSNPSELQRDTSETTIFNIDNIEIEGVENMDAFIKDLEDTANSMR